MTNNQTFSCHDADACALGQLPCPTPDVCGCGAPCPVKDGTHQPAEALHQIAEPDAQHLQELAAYRFTVENLRARVAELEAKLAAAPQAVPASAIAGAVFDFAGYLTTRPHNEAIHCSEAHEASPMVEAITEWCKRRGLCTDGANVENWRQAIATHPTQQGLEPTMFWDADDPERCESSINNVVVEVDNCRGLRVGDIVTIQRAVRLPNLEVRITQCPDAEGNGDLEWDEVDAAQAKQGGV